MKHLSLCVQKATRYAMTSLLKSGRSLALASGAPHSKLTPGLTWSLSIQARGHSWGARPPLTSPSPVPRRWHPASPLITRRLQSAVQDEVDMPTVPHTVFNVDFENKVELSGVLTDPLEVHSKPDGSYAHLPLMVSSVRQGRTIDELYYIDIVDRGGEGGKVMEAAKQHLFQGRHVHVQVCVGYEVQVC
ncbi:hypothetical protein DUNSADRAFT_16813 [Dunaliella salina]|uniref:Uncharacterized protein n=1 Tax=Dunaliella salina TaxID=3046 RepID=A0ABQ7G2V1_DUNSA|nr:hypothetical protein DUNSADRAFT_16813 [Dunaliella salina]|eukprot:KAF5828934.1 hypothetical protein DUNSADRAFT_16813 [Dunaliella salina]